MPGGRGLSSTSEPGSPAAGAEIVVGLNAVIVAVTDEDPRLLVVRSTEEPPSPPVATATATASAVDALPAGPLDPIHDRTLDLALRGWVRRQTGIELGYVEQLYTFGDRDRDPRVRVGGPRRLSISYLALVREGEVAGLGSAAWHGFYEHLPWEDWRDGRPVAIDRDIAPELLAWAAAPPTPRATPPPGSSPSSGPLAHDRRERVEITFGLGGAAWDPVRVLERYELLYEAGLVAEAAAERAPVRLGRPLALDHRRILATALGRLRGKLQYRPVVFELLPASFTLLQLQRTVEALAGARLHKQNFRRLVETAGLVEGTGQLAYHTGGRPAELFGFRREVLRERPAPGVGLPGRTR